MKRLLLALALTLAPAALMVAQEHEPNRAHAAAGAHEGAGAGAEEHSEALTMWKWVNFAILTGLLGWAVSKHAGPFFTARIAEIQKDINEAREVRNEAEARASAIEKRLANLDADLATIRADARHEMETEAARIQDETRRLMARAAEQTETEINAMSKAAEGELRQEASRLALELAEKKLKARMSPANDGSLVERFVAGLRLMSPN